MSCVMEVKKITYDDCKPWIIKKHYAHRMPCITVAFGLYIDDILNGIVSFGVPSSSPLRIGICGEKWSKYVLELNRLCIQEPSVKNAASFLVGNSLKLINKPAIIVSYADTGQKHVGYIYQATNFIYTGLSAKRTNWKLKGSEHLHGQTIADKTRGMKNRAEYMHEQYGEDFYLEDRSRKHRYVFFCGDKRQKKEMMSCLNYPVLNYPKGESMRYDAGGVVERQMLLV